MKICMLSPMGIYPERCDGPAINVYNLARSLANLGEECHVIAGTRSSRTPVKAPNNENIMSYTFTKDWGGFRTHDDAEKYLSSSFTPLKLALRIPAISGKVYNIIDAINPDILFYNLLPIDPILPLPFFHRLQKKVQVVRIPVWLPIELKEFAKNRVNITAGTYACRKTAKQFKLIVTQSTAMQQIIKEDIGVTPPCVVIPNGVEVEKFTRKANHGRDRVRILFVGRLSREKGIEDLIQALSLQSPDTISKIEVSIVGGGSSEYMLYLHKLATRLGIKHRITFHGEVDWETISALYKSSDIFVLPSYREGFPQVLLEAMASSLAIIATKISGVQDIIKQGNGLLFESGDAKKLAQYIEMLVNDSKMRRDISEKAYHTVLGFGWRNIGERYLEFFKYILNNP